MATKLPEIIFNVEVKNHELLKLAYLTYLSADRQNLAQTLKRGEVRGGGKKPWKQKGTGRARFGSSRNPIWRGGGIAFGPTGNENYTKSINVGAKRTAIRQALSLSNQEGKIVVADFTVKEGKVSETNAFLKANKITGKRILLVVADKTELMERAVRNIQKLQVVQARYLNVHDVMDADNVVIASDAISIIADWLTPRRSASSEGQAPKAKIVTGEERQVMSPKKGVKK
jgi:large subunit ribosomal protein L4